MHFFNFHTDQLNLVIQNNGNIYKQKIISSKFYKATSLLTLTFILKKTKNWCVELRKLNSYLWSRTLTRWRENVDLPQFFAPQIKAIGGGEDTELYAMKFAASHHYCCMNIAGGGASVVACIESICGLIFPLFCDFV